ncbi:hypothetical protein [Flavobacterium sp. GCM10027622]|uniref:hypothetical protein n=1 Tax=unclassified Flavobacterium TaxID=196869 RepID=UPI0036176049
MNKIIITTLALLSSVLSFSNEIFQLKLEKNEKLEATQTIEFHSDMTMHIAITKKSGDNRYFYTPFLVDADSKVLKCEVFGYVQKLALLSHHLNNNLVTLVNYDEEGKLLCILDFDLKTGQSVKSYLKTDERPNNVFRSNDKTTLIFLDKKSGVSVKEITNSSNIATQKIEVPAEDLKLFKTIVNASPDAVNQNEFVRNGSIAKAKSYLIGENYIVTYEDENKEIELLKFDLKTASLTHNKLSIAKAATSIRDFSNFVFDDKIAILGTLKEDAIVSVYDITTLKALKHFSFSQFVDAVKLKQFLKISSKVNFKSTLTANKGAKGNYVLRLDNVDANTYTYYNNWWLHHWFFQQQMFHQQMFRQQMIDMNRNMMPGRGFGPGLHDEEKDSYFYNEETKDESIQIVIDPNLNLMESATEETVFPEIKREKYTDKYKDDQGKKKLSFGFVKNELRYMYMDKESKTINISFEKL